MSMSIQPNLPNIPQSGWQLMKSLLNGSLTPSSAWQKPLYRLKFLSRSMLMPINTRQLLSTLAQNPLLPQILRAQPHLPTKLHRPYLAANMSREACLQALQSHYRLILQCMPEAMRCGYLSATPFVLAQLSGKDDHRVSLTLGAIDKLSKEGETTISLQNAAGNSLAEVTFSLLQQNGQTTLFIGGLQGAHVSVEHQQIQSTTKACHGLFPKRLVLEAVYQLAHNMGISHIVAVSNDTHIYRNWRYYHKKKGKLHADYNQFWASLGGVEQSDGHYLLPPQIARKSLEDIVSTHALWQKPC